MCQGKSILRSQACSDSDIGPARVVDPEWFVSDPTPDPDPTFLFRLRLRIRILFRIRQCWSPPRKSHAANSHFIREITTIYKVFYKYKLMLRCWDRTQDFATLAMTVRRSNHLARSHPPNLIMNRSGPLCTLQTALLLIFNKLCDWTVPQMGGN